MEIDADLVFGKGELLCNLAVAEPFDVTQTDEVVKWRGQLGYKTMDQGDGFASIIIGVNVIPILFLKFFEMCSFLAVQREVLADLHEPRLGVADSVPFVAPLPCPQHHILHYILCLCRVHGNAKCQTIEAVTMRKDVGAEIHKING